MDRKPVRGFVEEGGRSRVGKRAPLPSPAAMSEADAGLEARIRVKLDSGEALTAEEKAFFARMPADDERYY